MVATICFFLFYFVSSYLRASPVVCADGYYPFSNIHVTPRISPSITRSARRRVDGRSPVQVCLLPKVRADASLLPRLTGGNSNSPPLPRRRGGGGSGRVPSKEGGRRSVAALGVFPSQSALLLAEPRAPLAGSCTAATRLTPKLGATSPFVCLLVSFKDPGVAAAV